MMSATKKRCRPFEPIASQQPETIFRKEKKVTDPQQAFPHWLFVEH